MQNAAIIFYQPVDDCSDSELHTLTMSVFRGGEHHRGWQRAGEGGIAVTGRRSRPLFVVNSKVVVTIHWSVLHFLLHLSICDVFSVHSFIHAWVLYHDYFNILTLVFVITNLMLQTGINGLRYRRKNGAKNKKHVNNSNMNVW